MTQIMLPEAWTNAKLGQILPLKYGKGLVEKNRIQTGEIPVFGSAGVVGYHNQALIQGPALIVGRKGTVGAVHYSSGPCWPIDTTYYVEASPSTNLDFFGYVLAATDLAGKDRSTAIPGLNRNDYNEIEITLPPLPEQRRIVAEIETQFTRLDASVAALLRAKANVKRYRASVLKDACEGRLVPIEVELARSEGREYEPAAVLLERILAERRARWESQEKRRGKYREPSAPHASALPELPEGLVWASMEAISEVRLGRQRSPKRATGPNMRPYLRAANVTWNGLDLSDVKEMDFSPSEFGNYKLERGDILLSEASGSPDEVGKPAIWDGDIEDCCFQNTLIRVRAQSQLVPYLFYHLLSDARSGALGRAARGVGIHHLGAERTASWAVAFPPLAEQRRIVAEVERRLSVAQQAEATVEASLARAERLRQSILKQAFSGKLVPQDPGDEPASVLLERIKAERETEAQVSLATKSKARRPGKRKAAA